MNITKIYNSILPTYDKSGYNNKNLSTELLFFSVVIINKIDINDTRNFKDNILKHSKLFNFFDVDFILSKLNEEELKFILKVFAENIDTTNKEELFKNVSSLIDEIHSLFNPKHGQFYTNDSMSKLTSELLLSKVSKEQINEINKQEEISLYECSIGCGNLIFSLIESMEKKGFDINKIKVYGNEIDNEMCCIAKTLLDLKGIKNEIRKGDTLSNYFLNETGDDFKKFDFVIGNPPFGLSYNQELIINNKFFDLYKVKNKTTISKSSDSLFVFLEIIRSSYKVSASIIGSTSFLSFEKYYDDNTNTFKNSVLGNIIKEKQLETIVFQSGDMFYNTNIRSVILKLSNNNDKFNYIDTDVQNLVSKTTTKKRNSKISNVYSEDNIQNILNHSDYNPYNENTNIKEKCNLVLKSTKDKIFEIFDSIDNKSLLLTRFKIKILSMTLFDKNIIDEFCENVYLKIPKDLDYGINEKEIKAFLFESNNKEQVIEYIKDKLKDCGETHITFDKERFLCECNSIKYEYISPFWTNEKEKMILDIALNSQFELKCNFLF